MTSSPVSFSPLRITIRVIRIMTAAFVMLVALAHMVAMAHADTRIIPLAQDVLYGRDVFPHAGAAADRVVAPAPAPGGSITLDARTLLTIAKAMMIDWTPDSLNERVTITREANRLSETLITQAILAGLKEQGSIGRVRIDLDPVTGLDLPAHALAPDLRVETIRTSADQRIAGVLIVAQGGVDIARTDFTARLIPTIDLPVLRSAKSRGDIIAASDLTWREQDVSTLAPSALTDADTIIGTQTKRLLGENTPLLANDLTLPTLVKRGEPITLVLREGGMILTAKGRAIEQGARGDVIRVVNVASNKTMHGMITGTGEVSIQ